MDIVCLCYIEGDPDGQHKFYSFHELKEWTTSYFNELLKFANDKQTKICKLSK